MNCIAYKKGYKYQIVSEYHVETSIKPPADINSPSEYIKLSKDGLLSIKSGYAWDGPSGPTFDTLNFMRGSLVHDAFYQLMREGLLDKDEYRDKSDRLLQKMCREDGMNPIRAWWVYQGLRIGGDPAADPANKKPITHAPKDCEFHVQGQ